MKAIFKILTVTVFLLMFNSVTNAQAPPPPEGSGGVSGNGNVPGGGAPIGSGLIILMVLGAGYGAKKVYSFRKVTPLEE
jgi:hypothetical protein